MDFAQIRWNKIGSKDNLNSLSVSFIQIETLTRMHTQPTADLNSPFLPEFGGPGGLSVTDPVKRKKKNVTCTKQRLDSSNNSSGTVKEFDSKMLFIHFRNNLQLYCR